MLRRILLSVALVFGSVSAAVVAPTPAVAEHQGACWEVWDYVYTEWFYENGNIYPYGTYWGWWANYKYDVYRECEGHYYGTYLGRYSGGWHRCYCYPPHTNQDVYY